MPLVIGSGLSMPDTAEQDPCLLHPICCSDPASLLLLALPLGCSWAAHCQLGARLPAASVTPRSRMDASYPSAPQTTESLRTEKRPDTSAKETDGCSRHTVLF